MDFNKFKSPQGAENTTLAVARKIERCLNAFGIPTFGVYGNMVAGGNSQMVPEVDMRAAGVNVEHDSLCYVIKVKDRPDDPENSIPAADDWTNAAQIDNKYAASGDDIGFIKGLYADLNVLAPGQTAEAKLLSVQEVGESVSDAVTELWASKRANY